MRRGALVVADFAGPGGGNFVPSQIAASALARDRLGLDVHMVGPAAARGSTWAADVEAAGFGVSFLPEGGERAAARRIRSLAQSRSAAIVHSHFARYDLHCGLAGRATGAKVAWHVHNGVEVYTAKQRAKDLVKIRALGPLYDSVIAVSEQIRRDCVMRGVPERKLDLVLNGLVLERLAGAVAERDRVRAALGIPRDAVVFLAFGWDPRRKGVDLMLDATGALAGRMGATRPLLMLTGGDAMRAFAGGADRPWLRLQEPLDDVRALYAAADVFLSASREDAFSYAIGEAMACGLPVVSSDIPGPSHYYDAPGLTTFPSGDARALAAAMKRLSLDPGRGELGEANRTFAQRFDVRHYAEALVAVYDRLLGG